MSNVLSGLDVLEQDHKLQNEFKGNVALLCHSATVNHSLDHGLAVFQKIFGERLVKAFGPQHGLVSDVQDNMIETKHTVHPYFNIPVYSLYSETRIPTDEMLSGIDHLFIDMQDVGTRIYTYIYTMTHVLEACAGKNIQVIILDRPNPINAETIEGNVLDMNFSSFVGRHPLPVRHALTMAEVALMHQEYWAKKKTNLRIIKMKNYRRDMSFEDTRLPWVLPSPNLATVDAAYTFVGTVLFEGTNISEGRGSTRSLEFIGHPKLDPWTFKERMDKILEKNKLRGQFLRPIYFMPTFQKHAGKSCGGFQIHVTNRDMFRPWRVCQLLCRELIQTLGNDFAYKQDPYEYEYNKNPIDLINGTDSLRHWYEKNGDDNFLDEIESETLASYEEKRSKLLIY